MQLQSNKKFKPVSISISDADVAQCEATIAQARTQGVAVTRSVIYRAALKAFVKQGKATQAELLRDELLAGGE
jgi:hypothetical protein